MKRKRVFLAAICILLIRFPINAQVDYIKDYYPNIYKAEMEYMDKNYAQAFVLYNKAFNNAPPLRLHLRKAISAAIKSKNKDKAFEWLDSTVNRGTSWKYIKKIRGIRKLRGSRKWRDFKENFEENRALWASRLDSNLIAEIRQLGAMDQKYRNPKERNNIIKDTIMVNGEVRHREITYREKQREVDRINIKRVVEIIEAYGYPEEKLTGPYSENREYNDGVFTDIGLILTHNFRNAGYDLSELLVNEIRKGAMNPELYGYIYDYTQGLAIQTYGTQNKMRGGIKIPPLAKYPIKDVEKLDERRISIGLEPIQNHFRKNKFVIKNNLSK